MSCSKHFLIVTWKHHAWARQVTREQSLAEINTDMWGRQCSDTHVQCHTRYVCKDCGAVSGDRECSCDPERGEHCAIRLEYLAGMTQS